MQIISLKLNKEFKRAYYQGKFKAHPFLVTYMVKNRFGYNRVGITTSKKIGKAVQRNRARRLIREAYREIQEKEPAANGYDFVFTARKETPNLKLADLLPVMKYQIQFLLNQKKQPPRGRKKQ